jgi:hypothetical protein
MRFLTAMCLSFVVVGLAGSGCATGDTNISTGSGSTFFPTRDASTDTSVNQQYPGSCNPNFCVAANGGIPCCVTANGPCGIDLGRGCVGAGHDGG